MAHSAGGGAQPHLLEDHLYAVADIAASFGRDNASRQLARLAGLWHDLGKYLPGFQRYIRQCTEAHIEGRVPDHGKTHSAAGALWALERLNELRGWEGKLLARVLQYVIAGHHAGLDDWDGGLQGRLASPDACTELREAIDACPPAALIAPDLPLPRVADLPLSGREEIPGRFALWVRMLFSALVDADFLDTEAFMNPQAAALRSCRAGIKELLVAFNAFMQAKAAEVESAGLADTPVNRERRLVLAQCRAKALLYGALAAYLADLPPERLRRYQQQAQAQAPVLPALQEIEARLAEPLSNAHLARLCHLSEDYFIRLFRSCVGQSPVQYIQQQRVRRAAQRLLFSADSIDAVAAASGFGNRFYFSRVFARHLGVAPGAYRRMARV